MNFELWKSKEQEAQKRIDSRQGGTSILIEVAAQHPLREGKFPNKEFENRLNEALALYNASDGHVDIYVPGSLHMYNGVSDVVSLSEAGQHT